MCCDVAWISVECTTCCIKGCHHQILMHNGQPILMSSGVPFFKAPPTWIMLKKLILQNIVFWITEGFYTRPESMEQAL